MSLFNENCINKRRNKDGEYIHSCAPCWQVTTYELSNQDMLRQYSMLQDLNGLHISYVSPFSSVATGGNGNN